MSAWKFSESEIAAAFPMSPWVHQSRSVTQTLEMLERVTSLTLALPTGAGKTNCAAALLNLVASRGMKAMVLSNRKMLTEQLSDALRKFDIDHGVRAASLPGRFNIRENIQISSVQTELARAGVWRKHNTDLLIVDECVDGDSIIVTDVGPLPIKDCQHAKKVLSHDGSRLVMKDVVRWIPRGKRNCLRIELENGFILECTEEHPIKTNSGWMTAGSLRPMESDVLVDAGFISATPHTATTRDTPRYEYQEHRRKPSSLGFPRTQNTANVDAAVWSSQLLPGMGTLRLQTILCRTTAGTQRGLRSSTQWSGRLFLERCLAMAVSGIRIKQHMLQECDATMGLFKRNGLSTRAGSWQNLVGSLKHSLTVGSVNSIFDGPAIVRNRLLKFTRWLGRAVEHRLRLSVANGLTQLVTLDLLGGFAMTAAVAVRQPESRPKVSVMREILSSRSGSVTILGEPYFQKTRERNCGISGSAQMRPQICTKPLETTCQNACGTSYVRVKSVTHCGIRDVYDFEIADTHCFFANGMLAHNCHQFSTGRSLKFIQDAIASGSKVVLLTGTPIGISHITPNLIVGATNSELRACGAHVPAIIKCIREFDTSKVVRKKVGVDAGEYTEKSTCEWFARHQQQIVGVVYEDWKRFNPAGAMTLGVAPGSEEAITMASEFWRYGTTAAAITARGIWANGKLYTDDAEGKTRKTIDDQWQAGEIKVMWNRFIYREAIDRPGLYHLILATPIGSLKSYLQATGRPIRKSPVTPDHVIIQDHAGNFFNHGSPNEDRDWHEMYFMTEAEIAEKRKKKNKQDAEKGEEPVCCLKCGTVLKFGRCPPPPRGCGEPLSVTNPSRMRTIIQESGELIEVENITRLDSDPPKKERKPSTDSKEQKQWNQMFWKARNSSSTRASTFEQLRYLYKSEFGSWPPSGLKFMPVDPADMKRKVRAIPMDSLIGCDRQRGSDATG